MGALQSLPEPAGDDVEERLRALDQRWYGLAAELERRLAQVGQRLDSGP